MNKDRRKAIAAIAKQIDDLGGQIDDLKQAIDELRDEEQEYLDAMPEAFQNGDKGQTAQCAIDALESAVSEFDQLCLDTITGYLDEAAA